MREYGFIIHCRLGDPDWNLDGTVEELKKLRAMFKREDDISLTACVYDETILVEGPETETMMLAEWLSNGVFNEDEIEEV
jgi:hypothetical protein